ncbi:ABC transporter permease [Ferrovum sp. PN-J185]|uniref:ABC transporter permease n=1 Tax=Ferrovum sp. PN-J185 TaxID=1356306 RepID=UPI00079C785A|nr:ABC transporter permease [Ferrovum sp. PN-J185]KXW56367.1 FtsX-like permease family protein [Ferrovum sp. PN-J185]MCC6069091.1 ABC transporter permease [Ferrovum sp. PN-J185]MDE1890929.1 ABC transporter permease [Betaproteobacteria bacterium]MDE2055759.1 ABC transporter permease [Betaproteobacteria bacterium]
MNGLYKIAIKLLINDRGKFLAVLIGITFSIFLIIMMTSMFSGILNRASSSVNNIGAKIWVLDPAVTNIVSSIPLPDYVLNYAKSARGVKFASPLFFSTALAKLKDGLYQPISIIGIDDKTLFGRPPLITGNIQDIFAENGFIIVKDSDYEKLHSPTIGDEFEVNDFRAKIVGIAKLPYSGIFGIPTLYTTYQRAITYLPTGRFTISYILIEPQRDRDLEHIKNDIKKIGYEALTREEFTNKIADFYKYKTGLGINVLLMTVISFIVGLSISGQTFYSFIYENLEKFGALKAIGAKGNELIKMILIQSVFTSLLGYGMGVGLASLVILLARARVANYAAQITLDNLLLALGLVIIIAAISSYIGIRKVLTIQPFDIFRN